MNSTGIGFGGKGGGSWTNKSPKYVAGMEPFKASDLKQDVPRGTLSVVKSFRGDTPMTPEAIQGLHNDKINTILELDAAELNYRDHFIDFFEDKCRENTTIGE